MFFQCHPRTSILFIPSLTNEHLNLLILNPTLKENYSILNDLMFQ